MDVSVGSVMTLIVDEVTDVGVIGHLGNQVRGFVTEDHMKGRNQCETCGDNICKEKSVVL